MATQVAGGGGSGALFAFQLGGTPVRVHTSFFILSAVLGLSGNRDLLELAVWMVVVTFSVLAHEMGHALAGRACGLLPVVDLHGMGGTTSWARSSWLRWWQNAGISLAGPAVGFAVGALVFVAQRSAFAGDAPRFRGQAGLLRLLVSDLLFVNIAWGVFNLLPILPLDGGSALASLLRGITKGGGRRAAHLISVLTAGALLLLALWTRQIWIALLAGLFAWQNIQSLRALGATSLPRI